MALWLGTADLSTRECCSFKDFLSTKFRFAVGFLPHATPNFFVSAGMSRLVAARLRMSHIPRFMANRIVSTLEMVV